MTSPLRNSDLRPAEREQYAALSERMDEDEALESIAAERDADRRDRAAGVQDRRGVVASTRDTAGCDVVARPEPLKPALRALIRIVAREWSVCRMAMTRSPALRGCRRVFPTSCPRSSARTTSWPPGKCCAS